MKTLLLIIVFLIAAPCISMSAYYVTGKITGSECTNYMLFEKCEERNIDVVKGDDGRFYRLPERFKSVSSSNGRICWIRVKSKFGGAIGWGINMTKPKFYEKQADGSYNHVDVESIVFSCRESP